MAARASSAMDVESRLPIAAVLHDGENDVDATLAAFVAKLQRDGHAVRGLLQETVCAGRACGIALRDLANGTLYPVMQDLGEGSTACRLDTAALNDAGAIFRQLQPGDCDLVIFNRFGKLESTGGGFHAELLRLMAEGFAVIAVVHLRHLERWREFTGGLSSELPAEQAALAAWFAAVRQTAGSDA